MRPFVSGAEALQNSRFINLSVLQFLQLLMAKYQIEETGIIKVDDPSITQND